MKQSTEASWAIAKLESEPQNYSNKKTPRVSYGRSQLENSWLKNSPRASIQNVTGWVALCVTSAQQNQ